MKGSCLMRVSNKHVMWGGWFSEWINSYNSSKFLCNERTSTWCNNKIFFDSRFKVLKLKSRYSHLLIVLVKSLKILSVSSSWSPKDEVAAWLEQRKSCKSPSSELASAIVIDKVEKWKRHSRSKYHEHTQLHTDKTVIGAKMAVSSHCLYSCPPLSADSSYFLSALNR